MTHLPQTATIRKTASFVATAALALSVLSLPAEAGKPKGAKNADPKAVIKFYAGHTTEWSNGWVYWAPNGQVRIYWTNQDKSYGKNSVAVGTWTVNGRGTQCFQNDFHARKKGSQTTEVFEAKKRCRDHVVDPDGNLWARDKDNKENSDWWELKYELAKMKKGETKKSAFRALAKKFGVAY